MGAYLNPDNSQFEKLRFDKYFVDKTKFIEHVNEGIKTSDDRFCFSRPRRFGKTSLIDMLVAYYSRGNDSRELFKGTAIENSESFEEHLNSHNVISLDISSLRLAAIEANCLPDFPAFISRKVNRELAEDFPDEVKGNENSLYESLLSIQRSADRAKFIFLLDEWDVIYREDRNNITLQNDYTKFLRGLFKANDVARTVEFVLMTGILPVPMQATESGLNNFTESTMLDPLRFDEYVGFTPNEVKALCKKAGMKYKQFETWYDGYWFEKKERRLSTASVVDALRNKSVHAYWTETSAAKDLRDALEDEMPELRYKIGLLLAGQEVEVISERFRLDAKNAENATDILTTLVHLGYLNYSSATKTVRIPNREITEDFYGILATSEKNTAMAQTIQASKQLLRDTLAGNKDAVATSIASAHNYFFSSGAYNNESTLAATLMLAYHIAAEGKYTLIPEFPTGKGYADVVFLPVSRKDIPIVVELKYNKSAESAIKQIKERRYTERLKNYPEVLLVGISYEPEHTKQDYKEHTCIIELYPMNK